MSSERDFVSLSLHIQPIAIDQLIAFLHTTPLFARVEPAVVAEIAPELEHLQLVSGAIVIREGDAGDSLYLIVRGQLRVVAHAQNGAEIYLNDIEKYTAQLGLRTFVDATAQSDWGALLAMSTLTVLPIFILFLLFQRLLIEGIATTGMKR